MNEWMNDSMEKWENNKLLFRQKKINFHYFYYRNFFYYFFSIYLIQNFQILKKEKLKQIDVLLKCYIILTGKLNNIKHVL